MVRHIILGAASAAAIAFASSAAQAADLPAAVEPAPVVAVPSFSWTGAYVGVQTGYSWGRTLDRKNNGWMVGGYLGYNHQFDNSPVVIGLETDLNWANIDGRRNGNGTRAKSDWNGATRARLGYAFGRFLVYGAGGVAYSDRELRGPVGGKDSKTAVGWTVGGGVDMALTDNVIARVEYRHDDYGKDKFSGFGKTKYTDDRVMGGLAYKFNF